MPIIFSVRSASLFVFFFFAVLPCWALNKNLNKNSPLIANGCEACHGHDGRGFGSVPSIAGMSERDFLSAMNGFRSGERRATVMNRIAQGFSVEEFGVLAIYYASLPK